VAADRAAATTAVIAFGTSVGEPEPYRRWAEPGIRRAAEPDSAVFAFASAGPIARVYNLILEAATTQPDLEALVLVQSHVEISDPDLCDKLRRAFADSDVAVVGGAGATGVRSLAWWDGSVTAAPIVHRYEEHGGGELAAFGWAHPIAPPREVDAVDGTLLALSPWAVRNVRFDESLRHGHGFDVDYCLQVRAAGRKVLTADLRTVLHRSLELVGDLDVWMEAHVQLSKKWDGRLSAAAADEAGWKARARRAEAEREAARAISYSKALASDARALELERAMRAATETLSWRITAPLRRANALRARAGRRLRRAR
jgi:hypothetical protein